MYQRGVQVFDGRKYVVDNDRDHWFVTAAETGNGAQTYVFAHEPREYREFEDVCDWLQTSPDSRFTQGPMVSLATKEGRRTLAGNRLILTTGESREEREIAPQEQPAILQEHFAIVYP